MMNKLGVGLAYKLMKKLKFRESVICNLPEVAELVKVKPRFTAASL